LIADLAAGGTLAIMAADVRLMRCDNSRRFTHHVPFFATPADDGITARSRGRLPVLKG
jgi:hypothetical protein